MLYVILFIFKGKVHTDNGAFLREIIAESVAANPDEYSEAILGKPNPEYCQWIKKPESWGGAIELAVLSHFYGIEIDVVDTLNCIINRFGEDQNYGQRVLLIFDGIHYDPLYLEPLQVIYSTHCYSSLFGLCVYLKAISS